MNETDTLRGLIAKARRERDKSVRQLALTAQEAGHKIVGTTLNAIEAGTYHSTPTAETIRAIGWLANVSDEIAFAAAGRAVPGPPFAQELPPGVDDLTSPERRAAIAMLRALVAQRQEINRYEAILASHQTAPPGTSGEASEDQEVTPPREGGALLDFTPPDVDDLGVAAQKGVSRGRRLRDAQDQDAEDLDGSGDDDQ
ncbi:helix-turn-helix DNA binding protein [Mycobacterium phage Mask]|nr:helix-turn-helix DNA binding protein [Mycobacterium phage Mask]